MNIEHKIDKLKELNKEMDDIIKNNKKEKSEGQKQVDSLYDMFLYKMDLKQKEAFLLGHIYTILEIGNQMSEGFNLSLNDSEKTLKLIQEELAKNGNQPPISRKKKPTRSKTTDKKGEDK